MGACIRGFWCLEVFLIECDGVKWMQGCEEGVGSDGRQRRGKEEEARETLLSRMAIGLRQCTFIKGEILETLTRDFRS